MKPLLFLFIGLSLPSFAVLPFVDSTAETLQLKAELKLKKHDTNQDGMLQNDEEPRLWKTGKKFDANQDGGLDRTELVKIPETSSESPGKRLLNVCYKKVGKKGVYLDFYFPDEDISKKKPVVVFTHGGGWAAGSKAKAGSGSFETVHQAWLKEGFCVASVGYRLVNKDGDTAMRDCVIDAKDGIRFLSAHREELGIDPEKIYLFGDSAGGHLAQMLLWSPPETLTGDPELAKYSYQTVAGVSWYGPCDFQDIQLFNHDDREDFRDRFGARIMGRGIPVEEKEERYREMSPITYLTKDSPPLLMIQGDQDTTIPVKHAHRMVKKLKEVKAPVEISIVKNAGHNWRSVDAPIEPTREEIVAETIAYLLKHK